jgi:hypothetical protein
LKLSSEGKFVFQRRCCQGLFQFCAFLVGQVELVAGLDQSSCEARSFRLEGGIQLVDMFRLNPDFVFLFEFLFSVVQRTLAKASAKVFGSDEFVVKTTCGFYALMLELVGVVAEVLEHNSRV